MTSAWGVDPHDAGTTIWAVIEGSIQWVEQSSFDELLAQCADDEPAPASPSATDRVRVVLSVEVEQMLDSHAHTEDLVRELQLLVFAEDADGAAEPVVHSRCCAGGRPVALDAELYTKRNVVERSFNVFRQWRALATRYDTLALTYRGGVVLRAIAIWLRQ